MTVYLGGKTLTELEEELANLPVTQKPKDALKNAIWIATQLIQRLRQLEEAELLK